MYLGAGVAAVAIEGECGEDSHMQLLDRREFAPNDDDILCMYETDTGFILLSNSTGFHVGIVFSTLTADDMYDEDSYMRHLDRRDFSPGDELPEEPMDAGKCLPLLYWYVRLSNVFLYS